MDNGTKRTSWVCQKANGTAMCLMSMLLGLLLCVVSCQKDDTLTSEKEGTVSLLVNLGTPQLSVSSRGVSDDPKNEQNTWTNWDLLVDGSRFYRVTMLIVDSNNQLVAIKDWNDIANSLPTHVSTTLTGLQSNTTYRMIVVANYSSYDTWGGLTAFPDIANLTVGSNVSSTITNLNNYQLPNAGTDYVAAKQPQPLSLVQEFTTPTSGQMEVEGELVRTYARFRIEIANRSEKYKLTVNDLALGSATSKFGYRTEPLLMVDDDQIPVSDGNLSVSSTDAMTPFTALEVPTLNDASGNSKVAFDAYIYECKNTAGFEYSLNVGYPISTTTTKTVYQKGTGTTSPSSGLYMIGYGSNNYYLMANGTSLTGTQIASNVTELDATQYEQVIWEVTMSGNSIQIKSVHDDKYINISQRLSTPTVIISLSERLPAGLMGLFLRLDKGIASVCTDFLEEFLTGISGSLPSLRIKIAAKGVLVSLRMPFYITVEGRAGCPLEYLELQCHGTCPCHSSVIHLILLPFQMRDRLIQQSDDIVHGLQERYAREVHRFINVNRMVQPWNASDIAKHIEI